VNLDAIGRRLLPWVAAVLEEAVDNLLAAQLYVERWQRLLDDGDSVIDLDAVAEAL
jgi:hypothetical protein